MANEVSSFVSNNTSYPLLDAGALHPNGTTAQYYRGDGSLATFPTIPTVNNGTLTIQNNGTTVATFGANQSNSVTANITAAAPGNGTLTIKRNNTSVGTFSANQSSNTAINITVPTKTSDLSNDSNFTTHTDVNNALTAHNADTAAHSDIRTALNDEARIRYEYDDNLGAAIQNLGAVKQDKLTGTIGSVNNPIYLNNGTLTASDLNITRVRAISHNNVLAPNGLLITLPSDNSYGHGSIFIDAAYNGYPFQIMVGFAHTAADGIYQIHAKVHSNNNTNNNYIPTISYYTAANETCYIHLLWASVTERLRTTISCNNYDKVIISTAQKPSGVTFTTLADSEIAGLVSVERCDSNLGSETIPVYYNGGGKLYACTGIVNHSAYINTTFNANKEFQIVNGNFTIPLASMKDGVMYNFLVRGYRSTSPVITWNNNTSNAVTFYATNVTSTGSLQAGRSTATVISTYTFKVKNHEICRCVKIGNTVYIDMGY